MGSVVPLSAYRRTREPVDTAVTPPTDAEIIILQVVRIVRTEPQAMEAGRAKS